MAIVRHCSGAESGWLAASAMGGGGSYPGVSEQMETFFSSETETLFALVTLAIQFIFVD
jgi:hypothetical protein